MENGTVNWFNLPGYKVLDQKINNYKLVFHVEAECNFVTCRKCGNQTCTIYEVKQRKIKHTFWADRSSQLLVTQRRFKCRSCKARLWESLPGILPYARSTEALKKQVASNALKGHDNKMVAKDHCLGEATVQRYVNHYIELENKKKSSCICPVILGIDEYHFTKKGGYATNFCDLRRHKVFDTVLGRSEKSLEAYLSKLEHKERCKVICMDLSGPYRAIARKHFPNAVIVADRFHVVKLLNHHFSELWKLLDPIGRKNRGLTSLFRRKPSKLKPEQAEKLNEYLESIDGLKDAYEFRNDIHELLCRKTLNAKKLKPAIKEFLFIIDKLRESQFESMQTLANTFESWQEEILRMLRFSKNNGITEGFHNKMKLIKRRAYGFRNFNNYKQRVLLQCG